MHKIKTIVMILVMMVSGVFMMGSEMAGCTPPRIHQITPDGGDVGEDVTITGVGFGPAQAGSKVYFYPDIDAGVATSWADSILTITVPEGAEKGYVYLVVEGAYSNPVNFEIPIEEIAVCLKDTHQQISYADFDDGYYDSGCTPNYTDNGDGTVTDNCTGLMWQQEDDDVTRAWGTGIIYCEDLVLSGYDDWRMPNRKELESIVDERYDSPAIDSTLFPRTNSSYYWTSTTSAEAFPLTHGAWFIHFSNGYHEHHNKNTHYDYVRCVR